MDGTNLTVKVPDAATTGTVRLANDTGGLVLQVVPVLLDVSANANGQYDNNTLVLTGRGFIEATNTIHLGTSSVIDRVYYGGSSVGAATIDGKYTCNARYSVQVPPGAGTGPLSITTVGGTSNVFDLSFTAITATATSGTPANAATASANPGQTITRAGEKFDAGMDVVFETIPSYGTASRRVVRPASVAVDGTSATVVVPLDALTGRVRIIGDKTASEIALQIVPRLTAATVTSISSNGIIMDVRLEGSGFIDQPGSSYSIGGVVVEDLSPTTGAVIATLTLANYEASAGLYDPTTNHLFVLDRLTSPIKIVEIDPATGDVLGSFNAPINAGNAGMAIDPVTHNLWYGSDQSNTIYEITTAGIAVRNLSLTTQGVDQNEIAGLAFDAAGKLWIASTQGRAYRVTI